MADLNRWSELIEEMMDDELGRKLFERLRNYSVRFIRSTGLEPAPSNGRLGKLDH